ncbi:MAG: ABC transporter substrate-binding protein [Thermofilaceae archaeon]
MRRFKKLTTERFAKTLCVAILVLLLTLSFYGAFAQPPPREETLYIARGRVVNPTLLNLYAPGAPSRSHTCMHQFVWEYLFYYNFETGEYIPWLAEKFEYSPDYKSVKIYLRKGVKWSDGHPFTADDVVFTYEMLLKYAPRLSGSAAVAAKVAGARKIDDYTVEILLKDPDPRFHLDRSTFPAALVWGGLTIVPKHIWEKEDPLTFKNYPPVGTGPYRVVSSGETESILERRNDWWATELFGIRPAPKYIVCKYYGPEESLAAALAANDVDAVFIGMITFGTLQTVIARNPAVIVWRRTSPYSWIDPCPRVLMVNNQRYPWSLPEVRHAISYLLNRPLIAELVFDKTTYPTPHIFPEYGGMKPYLDAVKDLVDKYEILKYDPKKAEEILTKLGFKKGPDGIWVTPNGTKLEAIYIYHTASDPVEQRKAMEVITSLLRAAGISVIAKGLEGPAFIDTMNRGEWDLRYGYMCPGDSDPFFNLYISHSKFAAPPGQPVSNWEYNGWRYTNPEYDKLIDQLQLTSPLEKEKAITLFKQIMEIFYRDLPVIPVVQAPAIVPFSTQYWTGWPTAENPWIMPVPWWAQFNLVVNGYYSPSKGEWVGGIKPARIDYATVYFTKDTPRFRGIDLIWYGPFKAGDAARIPSDDAEFWIKKGYASYTPPIPSLAPELKPLVDQVAALTNTVSILKDSVGSLTVQLSNLTTLVTINLVISILLIIAVIYLAVRKK